MVVQKTRRATPRVATLVLSSATFSAAQAARVASVSPQGGVAEVRHIVVRFDQPVVVAGDPRLPAPFTPACQGAVPAGEARWDKPKNLFDLQQPLAAGARCTLDAIPDFRPLGPFG